MEDMAKRLLPHLNRLVTRHGKTMFYFRVNKGPRLPLPLPYGSPEFMAAYDAALAKHVGKPKPPATRTIAWLIDQFQASPQWATTAKETKKQFKYQFARIKERSGTAMIADVDKEAVVESRDSRADKPSDANKFVKATRKLFTFAEERGYLQSNPTTGVALLKLPNRAFGFHAWTEDEVVAFETRWAVGTRERLALDLLLYTGVRRSDVVRLGRQHVRHGSVAIKTEKSVSMGHPVDVEIQMLAPLLRSITATRTGDLTFLVTGKGNPFGKESFGNWFRKACTAAGVPGSAHGLRKIAAIRCAENGASEAMMNAMFGWSHGSRESATYIRNANRAKLSKAGSVMFLRPGDEQNPQTNPQTFGANSTKKR